MKKETKNKLDNVLKGLILSKEQKQQLIDVFEDVSESGNGGGITEDSIGILYIEPKSETKVLIGNPQFEEAFEADIEINEALEMLIITIHNENLYNYLSDKYNITIIQNSGSVTNSYSNFNIMSSTENAYGTISYASLFITLNVHKY